MTRKVTRRSSPPRSREKGHSKEKHLDPSDNKTLRGLESDDVPKSFLTKEEIQRVVREELEPVKSYLKEVNKELKDVNSRLADLFGSRILDTAKGKKVQPISSSVKDDDTIQGEVREESESEHPSSPFVQPVRSPGKRRKRDEGRNLQLQFEKGIPSFIYTEQKLTIDVKLVDANTGDIVKLGPESSVKVEVVALKGDSEIGGYDKWTWEGFEKSIEKEREGKAPLLNGRFVNLNRGTGVLDNVKFTDNSSWTRSKTFRLGLRASPEYRETIHEAITEPIRVKENRGQSNKKHDELAPGDEVWRIKTIGKNGPFHKNLSKEGICNVGQFFQLLNTESDRMKIILGTTITQKKWDELRGLAKTFLLNGNPHVSLDNEDDHQNGRQLTDHTADRVHCAADEFPPKQENHEDTIGKASSSFQYQVSEHPAPAQHNMARSTCAAPVGPEAPPANVGSTAEGHDVVTALPLSEQSQNACVGNPTVFPASHQPIYTNNWNNPSYMGDDAITPGGFPTQVDDINLQCAMASQTISPPSQMDFTVDKYVLLSGTSASVSSFENGHEVLTAIPLSEQSQNACNPREFPPSHQPTYTNNWNNPSCLGDDGITPGGLPTQVDDINLQCAMAGQTISPPRQMDFTVDKYVLPSGTCASSFGNGHEVVTAIPLSEQSQNACNPREFPPSHQPTYTNNWNNPSCLGDDGITPGGLPTQVDDINLQCAMAGQTISPPRQMDFTVDKYVLPSGTYASSFGNGHEVLTAIPLSEQSQNACNPREFPPSHQPTYTNNWNNPSCLGDDGITPGGLPTQVDDINLQCAMAGQTISPPRQMDFTVDKYVLPSGTCASSFGNGHIGLAPLASHQPISTNNWDSLISSGNYGAATGGLPTESHGMNSQYAMPSQMFNSWSQMDSSVNQHVLLSGSTCASISSFQSSSTPLVPGGNAMMESTKSNLSEEDLQQMMASLTNQMLTCPFKRHDLV